MSKIISEETKRNILDASLYINTKTELARMYGVSDSFVGRLLRGEVPVKNLKSPKVTFSHPTEKLAKVKQPRVLEVVTEREFKQLAEVVAGLRRETENDVFRLQERVQTLETEKSLIEQALRVAKERHDNLSKTIITSLIIPLLLVISQIVVVVLTFVK